MEAGRGMRPGPRVRVLPGRFGGERSPTPWRRRRGRKEFSFV